MVSRMSAPLRLADIGMTYQDAAGAPLEVVRDLSFDVPAGRLVCLAGRSGSGKTTVLMIAAGLLQPTAGSVYWGDVSVGGLDDDELTRQRAPRLGLVFQNAALIPTLRAGENVALPGMTDRPSRHAVAERVDHLLGIVGVAERGRHYPAQLSGGEQQRVALARALYRDPPLLVADEPTANLDRGTANEIIGLLAGLRDAGRALLVAAHDEALTARADHVVRLD